MSVPAGSFRYTFAAPFEIKLTSGHVVAVILSGTEFEFHHQVGSSPEVFDAYSIDLAGKRDVRLFPVGFKLDQHGKPVPIY